MSLPKFLYSKSAQGDEYITYIKLPTIGLVSEQNGQVRITIVKAHPDVTGEVLQKLIADMEKWYYFKFRSN